MTEKNSLEYPFVIQCRECLLVVGDSFSLVDYKLNYLILSSISSNASLEEENKESYNHYDNKCQYNDIICKCGNIIGMKYVTVNENVKDFFNKCSIDRNKVFSYQLGSNIVVEERSLSSLAEEVSKLQKFCVYLHNKLENNKK